MAPFEEVARIQAYLRESARRSYTALPLPPFTLFFHPQDALKYFNYAIPDAPTHGDLRETLAQLRQIFRSRGRVARFEFFEAFAPNLPAALTASGFVEEARQWSMLCTPATFQPVPEVPDLEIIQLHAGSSDEDLRDFTITQRQGFEPGSTEIPDAAELEQIRADRARSGSTIWLGRIAGEPVGVSVLVRPVEGVAEVAGIATREPFRRRGVAARLTWETVQAAFAQGVQTACLTAEDARAGRVYERVGFQPFSTMLAYIDGDAHDQP